MKVIQISMSKNLSRLARVFDFSHVFLAVESRFHLCFAYQHVGIKNVRKMREKRIKNKKTLVKQSIV